jgi:small subunit ribosomal protein S15
VIKLAKEGVPPSKIGLILRDEYGIPLVKPIVGMSITQILREGGVQFQVPEDLQNLLRKAQSIQRHLSENRGDKRNIHNLELVEARIHRLAKYYKRRGLLPADWKYSAVVAQLA